MKSIIVLLLLTAAPAMAEFSDNSCAHLLALRSLNQNHSRFRELGLFDPCTGRSNLCAPVSAAMGLSRFFERNLSEDESIAMVERLVRGSGLRLQDILARGFWPFEIEQALGRFFSSQDIEADVVSKGVHAFPENWRDDVFATYEDVRQLPDLQELAGLLRRDKAFTLVNFLGFEDAIYATKEFDPKHALEDFQQGRIFMAHYLVIDRILSVRENSLVVSGIDPLSGPIEFELIPFIHPVFKSRIYRMRFHRLESGGTFLTSAMTFVRRN